MEAIKIKVEFEIKKQDVQDLLVCAFEGGSNYWYDELEPLKRTSKGGHASDRFYNDLYDHGFRLVDKETGKSHEVKQSQFKTAFEKMQSTENLSRHFTDVMEQNTDASTGDVFLQLLVFGDVIYG